MNNKLRTALLNAYALVVLLPYGLALLAFWAIEDLCTRQSVKRLDFS